MLAQAVSERTKRSKKKGSVVAQKGSVNEKRTQEELFGRKMNGAKKMRKHRNDECKYGISKTQTLQLRRQRTQKGAPCDWATCHKIKARPEESLFLLREYHIVRVLEGAFRRWCRRCHVSKNDTSPECHVDGAGEALVFSLKTSHQLKTGGLVYRPVPGR